MDTGTAHPDEERDTLEHYWHGSNETDSSNMTAMACASVVIRYIYSLLVPERDVLEQEVAQASAKKDVPIQDDKALFENHFMMKQSSFLAYVICDPQKIRQNTREVMHKRLLQRVGVESMSFDSLMESEYMLCKLWSYRGFLLTHPWMSRRHNSQSGRWRQSDFQSSSMQQSAGLVDWNTKQFSTVKEAIQAKFGSWEGEANGELYDITVYNASPLMIRVRCTPERTLPDFKLRDIHRFSLPVTQHVVQEISDNEHTHEFRTLEEQREYCLIAVVRLRDPTQGEAAHDYVRLYDARGKKIVPRDEPRRHEHFVNDEWSLDQQDHSYMLYYIRAHVAPRDEALQLEKQAPSPNRELDMAEVEQMLSQARQGKSAAAAKDTTKNDHQPAQNRQTSESQRIGRSADRHGQRDGSNKEQNSGKERSRKRRPSRMGARSRSRHENRNIS